MMKLSAETKEAIADTIMYRCPWIDLAIDDGETKALSLRSGAVSATIEPAIMMIAAKDGNGWKKGKLIAIPWSEIEKSIDLLAASNEIMQIHIRRNEPTCKEINAIFDLATNGIVKLGCHPLNTK